MVEDSFYLCSKKEAQEGIRQCLLKGNCIAWIYFFLQPPYVGTLSPFYLPCTLNNLLCIIFICIFIWTNYYYFWSRLLANCSWNTLMLISIAGRILFWMFYQVFLYMIQNTQISCFLSLCITVCTHFIVKE